MDKEQRLPQAQDWNAYWGMDKTQRFTKISWSKRRIMRVCQPYLIPGHAALDAGCGSGFFSKFFLDQGLSTMALDYSEEALNVAKEKTLGQVKTVQADLTQAGLEHTIQNRFDVIFTDGLFEHFENNVQDVIMQNLASVLNPNGVIITFVPNKWVALGIDSPFFYARY